MMLGFLPPSSNDSFLNFGAATAAILSPVDVPPVKEIALISVCSTMACPVLPPNPCTMFSTPAGNPASMQIFDSR